MLMLKPFELVAKCAEHAFVMPAQTLQQCMACYKFSSWARRAGVILISSLMP